MKKLTTKDMFSHIRLYYENLFIGYAYKEVDGFYVFNSVGSGVWSEYSLKLVHDKLVELNKDWNYHIDNYACTPQLQLDLKFD